MSRFGDSRHATAPTWSFSTDSRPLVGTSRTYQGREIEKQNDCRIGSSPGPCYNPKPGLRVGTFGPAYAFGHVRVELDKRVSPGSGNYGHAQAPSFGGQRVDSTRTAKPVWGMGSSTRDDRSMLHLAKYHASNLPSRSLLGGHISAEIAAPQLRKSATLPP